MLPGITPALFGGITPQRVVILTDVGALRTWKVPGDWTNINTVECIGGGAGGLGGVNGQSGGGGGAYSKSVNLTLTPGASISYQIGGGGAGSTTTTGAAGGDTWFNGAAFPASGQACGAKGSPASVRNAVSPGGAAASGYATGTGSLKYSGGSGGAGVDTTNNCGAGGGGAGGPNGNGGNGAVAGSPGGGGGGNGGGANGTAGSNGGNNFLGVGGGGIQNGNPGWPGTLGGGGAGGINSGNIAIGGYGGPGADIVMGFLGGGGGGGGGYATGVSNATQGGNGGNYGGGGGGAGQRLSGTGTGGHGAQGIIIIKYNSTMSVVPDDYYTKLLLHMEGTAGSTGPFIDSSPFKNAMTSNVYAFSNSTPKAGFGNSGGPNSGLAYLIPATYPISEDFAFGLEDFTIDFWLRLANGGLNGNVYDSRPNGQEGSFVTIQINPSNQMCFRVNAAVVITGTALALGTWTHYALVRSSGVTKLYKDGVQDGASYTDTNRYINSQSGRPVIANDGYSANTAISALLDEMRVSRGIARWTAPFSPPVAPYSDPQVPPVPSTLLLLHMDGADASTTFTDSSPYARGNATVALGAVVSTAQSKFGGASLSLNGTTSYLTWPHSADFHFGTGDFTLECFVRFRSLTATSYFFSKWASATAKRCWGFVWTKAPDTLRVQLSPDGSTNVLLTQPWTPTVGVWYHVAAVRTGGFVYMYIDGVAQGTPYADSTNLFAGATELIRVGTNWDGVSTPSQIFDGWIDEIRVSNVARYTGNFSPPTAPFS